MPVGGIAGCRDRLVDHLNHSLVCASYHDSFLKCFADKMLCIPVAAMLLLQDIGGDGGLSHVSVQEGLPFTLWAPRRILASVLWRIQVIHLTHIYT
jgi:hypothetical protein